MSTHSPSPPSYHLPLNLERHIPMHQIAPEDHIITFSHTQHPRDLWAYLPAAQTFLNYIRATGVDQEPQYC